MMRIGKEMVVADFPLYLGSSYQSVHGVMTMTVLFLQLMLPSFVVAAWIPKMGRNSLETVGSLNLGMREPTVKVM